jgi:hypothetical protein
MISAAAHVLCANHKYESLPDRTDVQQALQRLIAFASGGLGAPATEELLKNAIRSPSQPVQAVQSGHLVSLS